MGATWAGLRRCALGGGSGEGESSEYAASSKDAGCGEPAPSRWVWRRGESGGKDGALLTVSRKRRPLNRHRWGAVRRRESGSARPPPPPTTPRRRHRARRPRRSRPGPIGGRVPRRRVARGRWRMPPPWGTRPHRPGAGTWRAGRLAHGCTPPPHGPPPQRRPRRARRRACSPVRCGRVARRCPPPPHPAGPAEDPPAGAPPPRMTCAAWRLFCTSHPAGLGRCLPRPSTHRPLHPPHRACVTLHPRVGGRATTTANEE